MPTATHESSRSVASRGSIRVAVLAGAFLALFLALWSCEDDEGEETFVQITDAHLFDEGKPRKHGETPDGWLAKKWKAAGWEANRSSFERVIGKIKEMKNLQFVVFTGDLGLEMAGPGWEDQFLPYLAKQFKGLSVQAIYFVPGNNDLLNEDPKDIGRYRQLVAKLHQELKPGIKVIDLAQPSPLADREYAGLIVHGLDSSTFKNSIPCYLSFKERPVAADRRDDRDGQREWLIMPIAQPDADDKLKAAVTGDVQSLWCKSGDIVAREKHQADEIARLKAEIDEDRKTSTEKQHIVFTHIPPFDDPQAFWKETDEERVTNAIPNTLAREDGERLLKAWEEKRYPWAWNLQPSTRELWVKNVRPEIDCIFAGHFHAHDRAAYEWNDETSGACDRRTVVAPPLALKFQEDTLLTGDGSRGYLVGTVTGAAVNYRMEFLPTDWK